MEWKEAVDALVAHVEREGENEAQTPIDLETSLTALTGWLESEVTQYTEGSAAGVGRRISFLYPNDYMLTLGTSIYPTIAHLKEEVKYDASLPFPESMLGENWDYTYQANGWERRKHFGEGELAQFVLLLAQEAGEPTLILPFEEALYMLEDEPWWDEEDENGNESAYTTFANLLTLFTEETRQATAYALGINFMIVDEAEYLPEYCVFNRFIRMTQALEDAGWFVNLDEHCAACSSGTREWWQKENPDKAEAPEFMTWGQNSQDTYLPNGVIWAEVHLYDEDDENERFLRKLGDEYGLPMDQELDDENYESTGSVIYGD